MDRGDDEDVKRRDGVARDVGAPAERSLFRSASELTHAMRRRELSPVEIVEDMLMAIEAQRGAINAFMAVPADEAREEAQRSEAAWKRGEPRGPLDGVPFVVKDLVATAGVVTTHGSRTRADASPTTDAVSVARLKAAGAILLGKTTTPEYGHKPLTNGPLFGTTRNPWALDRTPGGSSGGTAAAIAAGIGPIGIGTDGGGSIRIPAACCGIVGLKPSLGRVPHIEGADTFNNLSHVGPMTRTVDDARLAYRTMAGPHANDVLSALPSSPRRSVDGPGGLRVGWMPRAGAHGIDPDVLAAARSLAEACREAGAEVEAVELDFVALEPAFLTIMRAGLFARQGHLLTDRRLELDETFATTLEAGRSLSAVDLQRAYDARTAAFRTVQALFERCDVVVSPTITRPPLPLDHDVFGPLRVDGVDYPTIRAAWYPYTYGLNLTGHPAVSVPVGFTGDGLPIGAQLAGAWGSEELLLDVADWWSSVRPWGQYRPPAAVRDGGHRR